MKIPFIILGLLFILYWVIRNNTENMKDIPINKMTDADFDKLILAIDKSNRTKQRYGSFRAQYPWEISPWQWNQLILVRRSGDLNLANAKLVVLENKAPAKKESSKVLGSSSDTGQYI